MENFKMIFLLCFLVLFIISFQTYEQTKIKKEVKNVKIRIESVVIPVQNTDTVVILVNSKTANYKYYIVKTKYNE